MKHIRRIIFTSLFFGLFLLKVAAQPGFEDDVDDTPIDGGIAVLIASGLILGVKNQFYNKKCK